MGDWPNKKTQFPKGNPNAGKAGRMGRGPHMSTILRKMIKQAAKGVNPLDPNNGLIPETWTHAEAIIASLIACARNGDVQAMREVIDRIDGKLMQGIELGGGVTLDTDLHWDRLTKDERAEYKRLRRKLTADAGC